MDCFPVSYLMSYSYGCCSFLGFLSYSFVVFCVFFLSYTKLCHFLTFPLFPSRWLFLVPFRRCFYPFPALARVWLSWRQVWPAGEPDLGCSSRTSDDALAFLYGARQFSFLFCLSFQSSFAASFSLDCHHPCPCPCSDPVF